MANMSYCRFQNTELDLRDCVYALDEEDEFQCLSADERAAALDMMTLCSQYIEKMEMLINNVIPAEEL